MGELDYNKMKNLINKLQLRVLGIYLLGLITGVAFLVSYNMYSGLVGVSVLGLR